MAGAAAAHSSSGGNAAGEAGVSREQRVGAQPSLVSGGTAAYAVRAGHDCGAGDSRGAQELSGGGVAIRDGAWLRWSDAGKTLLERAVRRLEEKIGGVVVMA